MSLLKEYLKERGVKEIIEYPHGFVTYAIQDKLCYIEDMYVLPSERGNGWSTRLADEVCADAKNKGCELISCSIDLNAKDNTSNFYTIYQYGFRPHRAHNNEIYFIKEL